MNFPDKLTVKFNDKPVGTLALSTTGECTFVYDRNWLVHGFSLSPLELPLRDGLFTAKQSPFRGNFGVFEDSLPDGYGIYLIDRLLKQQGVDSRSLTPLQWLSIVGRNGMGALSYEPEATFDFRSEIYGDVDLDTLQCKALDVLSEKDFKDAGLLYYNSGNSGGCRPKAMYHDEEGSWIVKFRHVYDSVDIGKMEYEYSKCALACGIHVPEFKLLNNKYFSCKRFDIDAKGERVHVVTAGALLGESIHPPKSDYKVLLGLTGYVTQSPKDVLQMFRRMVFNVFSQNKDDHIKNFSFICNDGKWELAPAYDLTYCPKGYNGEHASSVNYNGNPTEKDMLEVAASVRISADEAKAIIDDIRPKCKSLVSRVVKY